MNTVFCEKCAYIDSSGMADHVLVIAQCACYRPVQGLLVLSCAGRQRVVCKFSRISVYLSMQKV